MRPRSQDAPLFDFHPPASAVLAFSHKSAYPFRILPQDFDWVHPLFIFLIKEGAQSRQPPGEAGGKMKEEIVRAGPPSVGCTGE
jgi:hypothetical protein